MKNILGRANLSKLLIVLALLVIGGVATAYTYYAGKDKQSVNSPRVDSTLYKATKYGFMFDYPKQWSAPRINESTIEGIKQIEVIFNGNSETAYSVVALMIPDASRANTVKSRIQKTLSLNKKNFLKYDETSFSTALMDTSTKSIGQINISQIVNLPKLNISAATIEVLLNPSDKCAGKLSTDDAKDCFTQADYAAVSQFSHSIRPL